MLYGYGSDSAFDDWNQRIAEESMINPFEWDTTPSEPEPPTPIEWSGLRDYLLSICDEWELTNEMWELTDEIPF